MKRVLIADDEPIERMIVSRTVEKYFSEELTVVSAANGREAVEQFFAGDCQIALLDIEMPGMNGLEAAEQIRKRDKNCSIIFLTAFDEFNYARRAIAVRAMEYLLKPVEDQELVAVLEEAVRIAEEQETDREAGEKKSAEQISAERDCHEDTADTERSRIRLQAVAGNIQAFIEHNYMDDISLQTVAEAMNYSDAYFCKIFKQCFDKNFIVYLSEYRVARAKELIFTGGVIDANEADRIGLVNRVVPHDDLMDTCRSLAKTIAQNAGYAVSLAKEAINASGDTDLKNGLRREADLLGLAFATHDKQEGMTAFLERRKPEFTDF